MDGEGPDLEKKKKKKKSFPFYVPGWLLLSTEDLRYYSSPPTPLPLPLSELEPSLRCLHELSSSWNLREAATEARGDPPLLPFTSVNMATVVTSTRFTDEYQLYEELGK